MLLFFCPRSSNDFQLKCAFRTHENSVWFGFLLQFKKKTFLYGSIDSIGWMCVCVYCANVHMNYKNRDECLYFGSHGRTEKHHTINAMKKNIWFFYFFYIGRLTVQFCVCTMTVLWAIGCENNHCTRQWQVRFFLIFCHHSFFNWSVNALNANGT